jgi:hypothetical protein
MFKVTTVNLSSDTTAAASDFGETDLGELSAAQFSALLDRFSGLNPVQNASTEPCLRITAPAGHFIVRTGLGRLHLYNARNTTEPATELTAEQIVAQLDQPGSPELLAVPGGKAEPQRPTATPNRGIALAILFAGLGLNGYTLYSAFYTESVHEKVAVTLLTDPGEVAAQKQAVAGTYITGDRSGDRRIDVTAEGRVSFSEIGNARSISNGSDTYRLGRREKKLCLITADSGVIDIVNIETVVYNRDTYRRTR